MNRPDNIVASDDLQWTRIEHGSSYEARRKSLSQATRARELGCSLYEVPPGKCAWPRHAHLGNEEAVFVLSGRGVVRQGEGDSEITAGDYLTFRRGKEHVHQIVNTGTEPLRYLCMSTLLPTEVVGYPDSKKHGYFFAKDPVRGFASSGSIARFVPDDQEVSYFDGEENA